MHPPRLALCASAAHITLSATSFTTTHCTLRHSHFHFDILREDAASGRHRWHRSARCGGGGGRLVVLDSDQALHLRRTIYDRDD
ncbi:hypothetical protein DAEQUDRAFT_264666 [Daedalea quercina L-15889]|uniref:Uncharacterized protein n=1 Tax=Daedalea quercina L-15889 TaxID=1314783 RepID=A0A165QFT3_9APHY|nr:hypothetical protein DAEQUDRAFT_264666 [Daedalea quercina L-15889]